MNTVLELRDVTRIHGSGRPRSTRCAASTSRVGAGRARRRHGPVRLGQVDAAHVAGGLDHRTTGAVLVEGADLATLSRHELARGTRDAAPATSSRTST